MAAQPSRHHRTAREREVTICSNGCREQRCICGCQHTSRWQQAHGDRFYHRRADSIAQLLVQLCLPKAASRAASTPRLGHDKAAWEAHQARHLAPCEEAWNGPTRAIRLHAHVLGSQPNGPPIVGNECRHGLV